VLTLLLLPPLLSVFVTEGERDREVDDAPAPAPVPAE
jgi:hypothetical protein